MTHTGFYGPTKSALNDTATTESPEDVDKWLEERPWENDPAYIYFY